MTEQQPQAEDGDEEEREQLQGSTDAEQGRGTQVARGRHPHRVRPQDERHRADRAQRRERVEVVAEIEA